MYLTTHRFCDDFLILRQLGEGSYTTVYQGKSKKNGEDVALKVFKDMTLVMENGKKVPTCLNEQSKSRVEDRVRTYIREKEILEYISSCENPSPFVERLFGSFHDEKKIVFVVTLAIRGDLGEILHHYGSIEETDARFYAAEILSGLMYLHGLGVVHRDMKPENVLVKRDGHCMIADLGSAKRIGTHSRTKQIACEFKGELFDDKVNYTVEQWVDYAIDSKDNEMLSFLVDAVPLSHKFLKNRLIQLPEVSTSVVEGKSYSRRTSSESDRSAGAVSLVFGGMEYKKGNVPEREGVNIPFPKDHPLYQHCSIQSPEDVPRQYRPSTFKPAPSSERNILVVDNFDDDEPQEVQRHATFVGTSRYISPEMIRGDREVAFSADIWGWACIYYQLVSGRPPFRSMNDYHTMNDIKYVRYEFPAGFPEKSKDLLLKLLKVYPEQRISLPDIMRHRVFNNFSWKDLEHQKPPYMHAFCPATGEDRSMGSRNGDALEPGLNTRAMNNLVMKNMFRARAADAEGTAVHQAKLRQQRETNPFHMFTHNHLIIKQGYIDKKKGLFARRRMFLLTEGPHLYYVNPVKMEYKGEVPLTPNTRVETKNFRTFFIHTPNRMYYLFDPDRNAFQWSQAIENTLKRFENEVSVRYENAVKDGVFPAVPINKKALRKEQAKAIKREKKEARTSVETCKQRSKAQERWSFRESFTAVAKSPFRKS